MTKENFLKRIDEEGDKYFENYKKVMVSRNFFYDGFRPRLKKEDVLGDIYYAYYNFLYCHIKHSESKESCIDFLKTFFKDRRFSEIEDIKNNFNKMINFINSSVVF